LGVGLLAMSGVAQAKCTDDAAVLAARQAADAACNCATSDNHGDYVSCVADVAQQRVDNNQLPANCKGAVTSCAAKSTCGKEGFVTCCRVDRRGRTKCSIKKEGKCKAPRDGSASTGTGSCCDACGGTSTTTAPPVTTTSSTAAPTTTTQPGSPSGAFF
jgi:hypothetical protein